MLFLPSGYPKCYMLIRSLVFDLHVPPILPELILSNFCLAEEQKF